MKPSVPTTATVIAISGIIIFASVVTMLFFIEIPAANDKTITLAVGSLLQWIGWIFGYFYGSSTSSKTKDDSIAALSNVAAGTGGGGASGTTTIEKQVNISTEETKP